MTFLHPILAAAGIAAVAIPIIIHFLMRRRRRPVMWGAMRFLLEAYREHRRRLRLEQILLLAARCLVIALIGLGLARPMFGRGSLLSGRAPLELYLVVDNSLTGSARGDAASALQRHKTEAQRLLDQLDPAAGDRAGLIALGGPAEAIVAPASADVGAVKSLVQTLEPTDSAADISGALSTLRAIVGGDAGREAGGRSVIVLLSDFLTGSADTEQRLTDFGSTQSVVFLAAHPASRGEDNVGIVAVEPLRPILIAAPRAESLAAERTPVTVRLRRTGPGVSSPRISSVRLRVSGADDMAGPPSAQTTVRWGAGESEARASIDLAAPSNAAGTLVLSAWIDDDAIAGDNTWRRTLEVRPSLRVGLIAPRRLTSGGDRPGVRDFDAPDWIRVALDPWFGERATAGGPRPARDLDVVEIEPASVDAPRLSGLDAVIVARPDAISEAAWRHLRHLTDTGGLVIVFPPAQPTVHLWADAMIREFDLDWTIAREPTKREEPVTVAPRGDTPQAGALLQMIESELPDLAAPVLVHQSLAVEAPASGLSSTLLALSDGSILALASPPGAGEAHSHEEQAPQAPARGLVAFITAATAIEWTNLPACPLMVPLLHETIVQGVARSRGDWSAPAGTRPDTPARTSDLRPVGGGRALLVDNSGRAAEPIRRSGLWTAVDDRGATRGIVAVHADPRGGRTDPQPASAIQSWLGEALKGAQVQWISEPQGSAATSASAPTLRERLDRSESAAPWAVALIAAALVVGLIELCMARWFSHARAGEPTGGAA